MRALLISINWHSIIKYMVFDKIHLDFKITMVLPTSTYIYENTFARESFF